MRISTPKIWSLGLALATGACGPESGGGTTVESTTEGTGESTMEVTGESTTEAVPTTGGTDDTATGDPSSGTSGDPTDPSIEQRCRDSIAFGRTIIEENCGCRVAAGEFPDVQTCLAMVAVSPSYADCVCPIYGKFPDSSDFFDCYEPAQKKYAACAAAAGCDQTAFQKCVDSLLPSVMQCQTPQGVIDEAEICED